MTITRVYLASLLGPAEGPKDPVVFMDSIFEMHDSGAISIHTNGKRSAAYAPSAWFCATMEDR